LTMNSTHAEIKFLLRYGSVATLFVVSPYKNRYRNSRPCDGCIKMMRWFKVNAVVYSTGDYIQPYKLEFVNKMQLHGKSRGDRSGTSTAA
jgi:hypothetical protein